MKHEVSVCEELSSKNESSSSKITSHSKQSASKEKVLRQLDLETKKKRVKRRKQMIQDDMEQIIDDEEHKSETNGTTSCICFSFNNYLLRDMTFQPVKNRLRKLMKFLA